LFEGYPGDVIFYSLESNTKGKIFYWHHEADIGVDTWLIANSFTEFMEKLYFTIEVVEEQEELLTEELFSQREKKKGWVTTN
jgi:hypothetical protein